MKSISLAIEKETQLRDWMRSQSKLLVAFSGGVDSTYLAYVATEELGAAAVCVTGVSPSVSKFQLESANRIARDNGFVHSVLETSEINDPNYVANSGNRCFYCKSELYRRLRDFAEKRGFEAVIVDGTNSDDLGGHRPGKQAALENSVLSPLADIGFTKAEIREMSLHHKLETWDIPASPCLASRVAVGSPVTIESLSRVERGEEILRRAGFLEFRLRVHGDRARIEISNPEMVSNDFMETIADAALEIKSLGFTAVSLDREGYRSGSHSTSVDYEDGDRSILL
jgi:uncharacterized protein